MLAFHFTWGHFTEMVDFRHLAFSGAIRDNVIRKLLTIDKGFDNLTLLPLREFGMQLMNGRKCENVLCQIKVSGVYLKLWLISLSIMVFAGTIWYASGLRLTRTIQAYFSGYNGKTTRWFILQSRRILNICYDNNNISTNCVYKYTKEE